MNHAEYSVAQSQQQSFYLKPLDRYMLIFTSFDQLVELQRKHWPGVQLPVIQGTAA